MVSFAQLRDARPEMWQRAADGWKAEAKHAASCADTIRARGARAVDVHWPDHVGARARTTLIDVADVFEAGADEMNGAVMILDAFADSMRLAQSLLRTALDDAQRSDLVVDGNGTVAPAPGRPTSPSDYLAAQQVQAEIGEAVRQATQADTRASAAMFRIMGTTSQTDPEKAVNEDQIQDSHDQMDILAGDVPVGANPLVVAAWWRSLTPAQQHAMELANPVALAGLNGLPPDVRDRLHGPGKLDRVAFVRYALEHWDDADIDIFGNNCANFVSTALHESGVPYRNNGWGTLDDDNWLEGGQTGWKWLDRNDGSHSNSWGGSGELHDFLMANGSSEVPRSDVRPGDVIFFKQATDSPNTSLGDIHHAAVVTGVTPEGDVMYTQHTDNRYDLSLDGRELHENTVEGQQDIRIVRVNPNWY